MKGLINLLPILLFLLCVYGYINNIIELVSLEPFVWTATSAIGVGGVFVPPIGVIMGLFVW